MITIVEDPIGKGYEREAYVHPEDPGKVIKISINKHDFTPQHDRELKCFFKLNKRKDLS